MYARVPCVSAIDRNLTDVRKRIAEACARSGRDPAAVTLVCVTKNVPPETIRRAVALGVHDLGENRVQEARDKQLVLGSGLRGLGPQPSAPNPEPVRWHLIGHLQRNKAKHAVELFDVVHSIDSVELSDEIERQAAKQTQDRRLKTQGEDVKPIEVFVQVNVSREATKFGCHPDQAADLMQHIMHCAHLRLRGLMTIAPFADDPEHARPHFRHLRLLRDSLNSQLPTPNSKLLLSMGMSQDFEVAIEEGADLIRIGTAIFGTQNA